MTSSPMTPTPWIGVWERLNIGVFMLWIAVLAIGILRRTGPGRSGHRALRSASHVHFT